MFSVIFTGILAGLLTIGWPIYQHLRTNRQNIQEVPSLLLFMQDKKRLKPLRTRHLFLMLARTLILASLFFLVAFPFFETEPFISLPIMKDRASEQKVIGLLIDDSATSIQTRKGANLLEISKKWAVGELNKQATDTLYTITTTTFPQPGRFLTRDQALEFIGNLKPLNEPGQGEEALGNLLEKLKEKRSAILVAAPLCNPLWEEQNFLKDYEGTSIHFLNTADQSFDFFIDNVKLEAKAKELKLECFLQGEQTEMIGKKLQVIDDGKTVREITLTPLTAQKKKFDFSLPKRYYGRKLQISKEDSVGNLEDFYFTALPPPPLRNKVLIVRPETFAAITADKIMTAVLLGIRPDIKIDHITSKALNSKYLQEPTVIVFIGCTKLPSGQSKNFNSLLNRGVRVLFLPAVNSPSSKGIPLVSWSKEIKVKQGFTTPQLEQVESYQGVSELMLLGISEVPFTRVHEPKFGKNHEGLITLSGGSHLLATGLQTDRSCLLALGLPLNQDTPFIYNPLFPLLIEQLLFPASNIDQQKHDAFTGEQKNLCQWLSKTQIEGKLKLPGGKVNEIKCTSTAPVIIPLEKAGFYTFNADLTEKNLAVNIRRPDAGSRMDKSDWEKHSGLQVNWYTPEKQLTELKFYKMQQPETFRYDLTGLFIMFIIFFIIAEDIFLLFAWRKKNV